MLYFKNSSAQQKDGNNIFPIKIRNIHDLVDKLNPEVPKVTRELRWKPPKIPTKVEARIGVTRIKKFDMEMRELTYEVQIEYKWKAQ